MQFDTAMKHLLRWEGGYVNDPDDLGGETNFGITKRRYPAMDIAGLTIAGATAIYRRDFYDSLNIHLLQLPLRYIVFDACVNQGPGWSIKALQKLAGVKSDGKIGPITAAACKRIHVVSYAAKRNDRYEYIARFRNNIKFLRGWLNRLDCVNEFTYDIREEGTPVVAAAFNKRLATVKPMHHMPAWGIDLYQHAG